MTSLPEKSLRAVERTEIDFEDDADKVIDRVFADEGARQDTLSLEEKRIVIKELALQASQKEVVGKLNEYRGARLLPLIQEKFDITHYKQRYPTLIDDVALLYAKNLARKFRFADRLFRVAKLSALCEHLNTRIEARKEAAEDLKLDRHEERAHNDTIKLLSQLTDEIDTQMGKIRLTQIDINVNDGEKKPMITNANDVKEMVAQFLKRSVGSLNSIVDANFSEVTDYEKCGWGEEWTSTHYCRYHGEECKVKTGAIQLCPYFLNKGCVTSKEWLQKGYVDSKLSVKELAELAGCKEVSQKVVEYVRGKLHEHGVERAS
jgi:hypothetical protein